MKKAATALALAVMSTGAAQGQTIIKERFGCHTQAVTERLFQLVQADDERGFDQLLTGSLASGECRNWTVGEEVVPTQRTQGYVCLAAKDAGGACYWTPISAIDAPK